MVSTSIDSPSAVGAAPTRPVQRSRQLAVVAAATLGMLCLLWELWWSPTGSGTLALKSLPVLVALPGLWRMRLYTYRWLSLAVWLYATEGLVRATSETGMAAHLLAWGETALALVLFGACGWHVRARLTAGRRAEMRPAGDAHA